MARINVPLDRVGAGFTERRDERVLDRFYDPVAKLLRLVRG